MVAEGEASVKQSEESVMIRRIIIRSEIERKKYLPNITEDTIVFALEIQPGVFCGSRIISLNNHVIKFSNKR